jgi:hypothetical protein
MFFAYTEQWIKEQFLYIGVRRQKSHRSVGKRRIDKYRHSDPQAEDGD